MSLAVLIGFWHAALIPAIAVIVLAVVLRRRVRHEDWILAVVFFVSWVSMAIEYDMVKAGLATWIVYALYPIPQVGVLAWGFGARWPSLRGRVLLLSISPTAVAALTIVASEWWAQALPARPEMGTLAVASCIALAVVFLRSDVGKLRQAVVVMAFGATLPATIIMGRAFDAGRLVDVLWYWKVCFTIAAVLAAVSVWHHALEHQREAPAHGGVG